MGAVPGVEQPGMTEESQDFDNLGVGVAELDRQHRILVDLTREMVRATEEGRDSNVVEALFSGLLAYTAEHFRDEEALMEQAGFPGLEAHRTRHQDLLAKARDFHDRYREGNVEAAGFGMFFMGWVVLHIRQEDRDYTECLNNAGIR